LGSLPRSRISGHYGNSSFNFLRNFHRIFHSGYSILHSYQQFTSFQFLHSPSNTYCDSKYPSRCEVVFCCRGVELGFELRDLHFLTDSLLLEAHFLFSLVIWKRGSCFMSWSSGSQPLTYLVTGTCFHIQLLIDMWFHEIPSGAGIEPQTSLSHPPVAKIAGLSHWHLVSLYVHFLND
jgi:hypothetical protein